MKCPLYLARRNRWQYLNPRFSFPLFDPNENNKRTSKVWTRWFFDLQANIPTAAELLAESGITVGDSLEYNSTLAALSQYDTNGFIVQTATDIFTGRSIQGSGNQITVTNQDGTTGSPQITLADTIDLGSKTSLEIPNSTSVTVDTAGEVAIDTDTDNSNITHGSMIFHDGTSTRYVVSIDALPSTDGHALMYDSTNKKFAFSESIGTHAIQRSWLGV